MAGGCLRRVWRARGVLLAHAIVLVSGACGAALMVMGVAAAAAALVPFDPSAEGEGAEGAKGVGGSPQLPPSLASSSLSTVRSVVPPLLWLAVGSILLGEAFLTFRPHATLSHALAAAEAWLLHLVASGHQAAEEMGESYHGSLYYWRRHGSTWPRGGVHNGQLIDRTLTAPLSDPPSSARAQSSARPPSSEPPLVDDAVQQLLLTIYRRLPTTVMALQPTIAAAATSARSSLLTAADGADAAIDTATHVSILPPWGSARLVAATAMVGATVRQSPIMAAVALASAAMAAECAVASDEAFASTAQQRTAAESAGGIALSAWLVMGGRHLCSVVVVAAAAAMLSAIGMVRREVRWAAWKAGAERERARRRRLRLQRAWPRCPHLRRWLRASRVPSRSAILQAFTERAVAATMEGAAARPLRARAGGRGADGRGAPHDDPSVLYHSSSAGYMMVCYTGGSSGVLASSSAGTAGIDAGELSRRRRGWVGSGIWWPHLIPHEWRHHLGGMWDAMAPPEMPSGQMVTIPGPEAATSAEGADPASAGDGAAAGGGGGWGEMDDTYRLQLASLRRQSTIDAERARATQSALGVAASYELAELGQWRHWGGGRLGRGAAAAAATAAAGGASEGVEILAKVLGDFHAGVARPYRPAGGAGGGRFTPRSMPKEQKSQAERHRLIGCGEAGEPSGRAAGGREGVHHLGWRPLASPAEIWPSITVEMARRVEEGAAAEADAQRGEGAKREAAVQRALASAAAYEVADACKFVDLPFVERVRAKAEGPLGRPSQEVTISAVDLEGLGSATVGQPHWAQKIAMLTDTGQLPASAVWRVESRAAAVSEALTAAAVDSAKWLLQAVERERAASLERSRLVTAMYEAADAASDPQRGGMVDWSRVAAGEEWGRRSRSSDDRSSDDEESPPSETDSDDDMVA